MQLNSVIHTWFGKTVLTVAGCGCVGALNGMLKISRVKSSSRICNSGSTFQYSKTCLKWPLKTKNCFFKADYCLMQIKSCTISYHLSLRSLFCLFLNGRLRHVLLYTRCLGFNGETDNHSPACTFPIQAAYDFLRNGYRRCGVETCVP